MENIFTLVDTNANGSMDFPEFVQLMFFFKACIEKGDVISNVNDEGFLNKNEEDFNMTRTGNKNNDPERKKLLEVSLCDIYVSYYILSPLLSTSIYFCVSCFFIH